MAKNATTAAGATDAAAKTAKPRVAPETTAIFAITPPAAAASSRGSKSSYPFDKLEVNTAFGIKNKTAKQMSSIVSNQNRADRNQQPKKDAAGNIVYVMQETKDAAGNVVGRIPTQTPEKEWIKEYRAVDVDAALAEQIKETPLAGSSVLVFRIK